MDLPHLKKNWFIYIFVIQLVVQWVTFGTQIQVNTDNISELKEKQNLSQVVLVDIQTRLASIETSLIFIKDRI